MSFKSELKNCRMERKSAPDRCNIEFGFCDDRGRQLGASVYRDLVEFIPLAEGEFSGFNYHRKTPGIFFRATVTVTRDGELFGAGQVIAQFETAAQRENYINRRVDDAKARYAKKFIR